MLPRDVAVSRLEWSLWMPNVYSRSQSPSSDQTFRLGLEARILVSTSLCMLQFQFHPVRRFKFWSQKYGRTLKCLVSLHTAGAFWLSACSVYLSSYTTSSLTTGTVRSTQPCIPPGSLTNNWYFWYSQVNSALHPSWVARQQLVLLVQPGQLSLASLLGRSLTTGISGAARSTQPCIPPGSLTNNWYF